MRTPRRIVLILAIATFGCASVPTKEFAAVAPPKPNESLVYVYRMTGQHGTWVPIRVTFNGREVIKLPNMTAYSAYLPSTPLAVRAYVGDNILTNNDDAKIELRTELLPGATRYFKILGTEDVRVQGTTVHTKVLTVIREVSSTKALEEMSKLAIVATQ